MASRSEERLRSSVGNPSSFGVSPISTRRDHGSSGGSRPAQNAESSADLVYDSGWQVVDARNGRSGRSWTKLFRQLNKLLDDIYLTCELDCSLVQVQTLVRYLEESAADFAELHAQLESVVSPSGQKVAWEVRTFRRASSRSPRFGAGPLDPGGSPSSNAVRSQGPFGSAFSASSGIGPGLQSSWAAAVAAGTAATGGGLSTARSASTTAIGGGAPPEGVEGPGPGPGSAGGAVSFGAAVDGEGGDGASPWKGKVKWSELFALQQRQQHQRLQGASQGLEGGAAPPFMEAAGGGGAGPSAAGGSGNSGDRGTGAGGGNGAAAFSGGGGGRETEFRLGSAPPPPRLKMAAAGSGSGSASGEGSNSPPTGPTSPLDALYQKMLASPSRKLSPSDLRRASEERQARAEKARQAMVEERLAKLAQANQSRQTAKSIMEERAGAMAAQLDSKIARSAELRQAHLAERVQKAVEETKKVAEVAFINQMLEQDRKLALQEKLEEGETRRRQALEALQQRGKGAAAAVEEAQERRKLLEAERREQLADRQRRKLAAQAKLEEERRAAAAAREAASRAQRAAAAQAAEARQRLRDVLSVRIEERLAETASRRVQHLELIKERAALGKDLYERRTVDGCTTSPRSPQTRYTRPPSPEAASAGPGNQQLPPLPLGHRPLLLQTASGPVQGLLVAGPLSDAGGPIAAGTVVAAAAPLPCPVREPLRSTDLSITLSADPKRRLKGMRRRACKSLARLEAGRPEYEEPLHLQALLDSSEGRELVTAWAALVETGLRHTAAAAVSNAAGDNRRKAPSGGAPATSSPPPPAVGGCRPGAGSDFGTPPPAAATFARHSGGGAGGSPPVAAAAAAAAGMGAPGGSGSCVAPAAAAAAAVKHLLQRVHTDLGGRSKGVAIHAARPSGLLTALTELLTAPAAAASSHPPQTSVQLMELLALLVTSSPQNAAWLLARCGAAALAGLVRCGMRALDRYNGLAADEVWEEPPEARYLAALLQTLACLCRTPFLDQPSLHTQQEELVAYVVACGLIHRSTELFSLFDQPAANDTAPIPGYVLQCLALLEAITGGPGRRAPAAVLTSHKWWQPAAANGAAIALAFQETSMAGLPSLLTAVLLRAAPSCTPAEARPERLPPNFVEAAACVMRVFNNIARLDLVAAQSSLGASDLRVVFFHLIGFLLSYCTNQWPRGHSVDPAIRAALGAAAAGAGPAWPAAAALATAAAGATLAAGLTGGGVRLSGGGAGAAAGTPGRGPAGSPPVPPAAAGLVQLLNEVLLLIGYYGLLQPANQDVLLWGKSPTLLQRLAEVPFPYFVEQQLYQVLMPTLVAVCYGSDRACATLAQHMDLYLLRNYMQTMMRQTLQPSAHALTELPGLPHPPGPDQAHAAPDAGTSTTPPEDSIGDMAQPAAGVAEATPMSPRRQLLHDLPISTAATAGRDAGAPCAVASSSGGLSSGAALAPQLGHASCSHAAAAAAQAALAPLPAPTAERYSLPQRFPLELLPQVLAFLERQMPGAAERSTEASLAAAVAAAAAAGRLTAATALGAPRAPPAPQMSSTPFLAVMSAGEAAVVSGSERAVAAGRTNGAGVMAVASSSTSSQPGAGAGTTMGQGSMAGPQSVATTSAMAAPGGAYAGSPSLSLSASKSPSLATPASWMGSGAAAESPAGSLSASTGAAGTGGAAGGVGRGSAGRTGSGGSTSYSHSYSHHFRRYFDAGDVPVPFAAGGSMGVRRNRLFDAATMSALVAAAAGPREAGGGGAAGAGVGGGGGGSVDGSRMDCARSYVSELSFGGFLQGESREGDLCSPGEDERILLDELDLDQYEQQRLDEQQHLDEQDVLLLDIQVEGGGRQRQHRSRSAASARPTATAAATPAAEMTAEVAGRGRPTAEPMCSGDHVDLRWHVTPGIIGPGHVAESDVEASYLGAASGSDAAASRGLVMDAWWRQLGQQFGAAESDDTGSDP